MRVALKDRAIHKCARVAFVGIADNIFLVGLALAGNFPFQSGWEPSATTATETAFFHFFDNLGWGHFGQTFCQGSIPIARNVFFDVFRIDKPAVTQRNTQLFAVKPHVFRIGNALFGLGVHIKQTIYLAAFNNVFCNNFNCIVGFHLGIKCVIGHHFHDRTFFAKPETSGCDYLNFIF